MNWSVSNDITEGKGAGGTLAATREDVDRQIAVWQAEHTGPAVALADLLCDRHAAPADPLALRYQDAAGTTRTYSFAELRDHSARFASVLRSLGVAQGDRVATLLPKSPELVIATLGVWRLGAVHLPLFTAFGPKAIDFRTGHCGAHVIVTDMANRPKLAGMDVCVATVAAAEPLADVARVGGDDLFILIYTSGTTGQPKGVEVPVRALTSFAVYMRFGLMCAMTTSTGISRIPAGRTGCSMRSSGRCCSGCPHCSSTPPSP
jgi:acetyl-CoA synthetase